MTKLLSLLTKKSATLITLSVIAISYAYFLVKVDLNPDIKPNFFFSEESKIFQKNEKILKEYPMDRFQLFIGVPNIGLSKEKYVEIIEELSNKFKEIDTVKKITSLTHGPSDPEDGLNNPLWKRLIVGSSKNVTFIVLSLSKKKQSYVIKKVENIISQKKYSKIDLKISGIPFFVEQMKRNLSSDMKTFIFASIFLCSLVLLIIFKSIIIVSLSLLICSTTPIIVISILNLMGYGIGLITPNLIVISYVLSLSHFIFLTSNYLGKPSKDDNERIIYNTLISSFWCMLTTLLGFVTLIFVEAKPLIELGIGGTVATLTSFISVYLMYVPLLRFIKKSKRPSINIEKIYKSTTISFIATISFIVIALLAGIFGFSKLDTDPSLLEYFSKDGKIYEQFTFFNQNGGSNPLKIVITRKDGKRFDSEDSYKKLQNLHRDLKKIKHTGKILSLSVLMSEVDEHWLGQFIPWSYTDDILSTDLLNNAAKSFVSEDRKEVIIILRMIETKSSSDVNRLEIIEDIKNIVSKNQFNIEAIGGTYYLQGKLAQKVKNSLITGVIILVIIFSVITFIISSSVKVSHIIGFLISLLVISIFGILGVFAIPVDIISAPAINIALGIVVDNIIHLLRRVNDYSDSIKDNWYNSLKDMTTPILVSAFSIFIGFSVFMFSNFPPSQRFGGIIMLGTIFTVPLAISVIPYLRIKTSSHE